MRSRWRPRHLPDPTVSVDRERRCLHLTGAVQGVGFRPFVYRLARDLGLAGSVCNSPAGVIIVAEGPAERLDLFVHRLEADKPPAAVILTVTQEVESPRGERDFVILPSTSAPTASAVVLADRATCAACLAEINDPSARRYRYPFTTCTHCGPRFTIMTGLPYDRPATTLADFPLCADCRSEYTNPEDRRFHAQPLACPACGPHLALWSPAGEMLATQDDALRQTVTALQVGQIVAVKGIGGFHLVCDAHNEEAVQRLRARKHRPFKPFAVMAASLAEAARLCEISALEAELLTSPAAPIVLMTGRGALAPSVAPDNPTLGVMLPSSPLHHLLMQEFGRAVVATSGNRASEPVCLDEREALDRLGGLADLLLVHNRPIAHRADDSIVRVMAGRVMMIRRARGYAPMPLPASVPITDPVLALGSHLKNTVALEINGHMILSPHVGDLETKEARAGHDDARATLTQFYQVKPARVVRDRHPDFTPEAGAFAVQHHHAHALACLLDNGLSCPALAVVWDGLGYGTDGTLWGGEFLQLGERPDQFARAAHLWPFPLIGGDAAARYPARAALGLLSVMGEADRAIPGLSDADRRLMLQALARGINCPMTTSAGRLFDGVAALLGLCAENTFEGQAGMVLEFAALAHGPADPYPLAADPTDWRPILTQILAETDTKRAAARFHATLAQMIAACVQSLGETRVLLTGGCFQNKALLEQTVEALRAAGITPFWHHHLPPNDGGIAAGQVVAAAGMEGA